MFHEINSLNWWNWQISTSTCHFKRARNSHIAIWDFKYSYCVCIIPCSFSCCFIFESIQFSVFQRFHAKNCVSQDTCYTLLSYPSVCICVFVSVVVKNATIFVLHVTHHFIAAFRLVQNVLQFLFRFYHLHFSNRTIPPQVITEFIDNSVWNVLFNSRI